MNKYCTIKCKGDMKGLFVLGARREVGHSAYQDAREKTEGQLLQDTLL